MPSNNNVSTTASQILLVLAAKFISYLGCERRNIVVLHVTISYAHVDTSRALDADIIQLLLSTAVDTTLCYQDCKRDVSQEV